MIKIITYKNQEEVDELLGDVITQDLGRILASIYDGNIDSLYNVIINMKLNEYVRSATFKSLEILQKYNIISQKQIINIIENIINNELKDDDSIVITDIVVYIAENKLYNKIELVKKLYQEYRVNEQMIGGYDDFIDEIYGNKAPIDKKKVIEDTIEELSWWACFNKEKDEGEFDFKEFAEKLISYENKKTTKEMKEIKKIGRNDLCYCGSRKKYKKCCMNKKR